MADMLRMRRCLLWLFVLVVVVGLSKSCAARDVLGLNDSDPRRVMTFYYPWYGMPDGPGGAGSMVHWGRVDEGGKGIEASTDYPELGAYDSHDLKLVRQHCRWAKEAGIDTLIISWWGHDSYADRAMDKVLSCCHGEGLTACIYYETVPRPQTPRSAADDIVRVLRKYGAHSAYLKVKSRPVVFVYSRALGELGLMGWHEAVKLINGEYEQGVAAIGDSFSYGSARVFDGVHTYNVAGSLKDTSLYEARKWAASTYKSWVQAADEADKISTLTVIPGYDDTKIREPGLAIDRHLGRLYRVLWEEAIKARPQWILITSFNEWHEGSEIEPSLEYSRRYLELTAEYAAEFKAGRYVAVQPGFSERLYTGLKDRLREKLKGLQVGVLSGAESAAFWWLLDMGVDMEILKWQDVVSGDLTVEKYPVLLYCAGEHYRRSVQAVGDVDDTLAKYLQGGGCLMVLPSAPWPFYYDEQGNVVNSSGRFGLTLRMGWERPPRDSEILFVQPKPFIPDVPAKFAFPKSGDLRWRPFFARAGDKHTSLLQLRDSEGEYFGDAIAYSELNGGGKVLYVWFGLLDGPYARFVLADVFEFLATQLRR